MQPTQADRASFQDIIHSKRPLNDGKISKAYQFFANKIQQEHIDIQKLKKVISDYLSVVSIVLDKEDDPHLVFESLNAKGRSLTQSDLIRNYFFMKIHINEQDSIYAQYWKPMEDAFPDNLTECIRHYLMKDGAIVKQTEVYFSLKDRINQGNALAQLKELARFAEYYQKFVRPEKETDPKIRRALDRLKRLDVATAYPFLLNCYDDYCQAKLTASELVKILQIIENFVIRRFVCNISTKPLNKIFATLCVQIKDRNSVQFIDELKAILQTKGYPKDTEFRARLIDAKLYGAGDRATKTKLILETFEESYQHKEMFLLKNFQLNILCLKLLHLIGKAI